MSTRKVQVIATNKRQIRNYELLDSFECGIVLTGSEVKSIRAGNIDLTNSYCTIYKDELFLDECYIKEYMLEKSDPTRRRKLLMHKSEIKKIKLQQEKFKLTIVVKGVYWKNNKIKFQICLARGLKKYDKREKIRKEETDKKIQQKIKNYL
ncbi:SsrA-binding protein SmpB [Mycoplasmopsis equigenitalium]|uniref:SsrA-binding protein n=1 Tax=Mycoplasmopsis equigenitalium TaxID=114883 RepID=A0ABY5J265_9BACT|nr:SsrA-binding protein SmpB [Mycoplasmopsis equigenitalium]